MSRAKPLVLIVDDEPQIRRFLRASLPAAGFDVLEAADGQAALRATAQDKPDLIILDLGLPDIDGVEIVRRVRETTATPIVILSARDQTAAKVDALDLGADDYIVKPFAMEEMVARLRAALRHRLQEQGAAPIFKASGLEVDLVRRRVTRDGADVHLTPKEYDLLAYMVRHAGKVVTHRQLLREVWGAANESDIQYLRSYMRTLRQKIEAKPDMPALLVTETGVGYRLVA